MTAEDGVSHLFIIGAMKSATTSLHYLLRQNHRFAGNKIKEMNYFEKGTHDPDRYIEQFDIRPGVTRYTLESSTNYTKLIRKDAEHEEIPRRLAALKRPVKLIYILRNPVDRAESHLDHSISHNRVREGKPIDYDWLVATSSYARHVDIYLRHFRPDQLMLCSLDELRASPDHLLDNIYGFLDMPRYGHTIEPPKKQRAIKTPLFDDATRAELAQRLIGDVTRLASVHNMPRAWYWKAQMEQLLGAESEPARAKENTQ